MTSADNALNNITGKKKSGKSFRGPEKKREKKQQQQKANNEEILLIMNRLLTEVVKIILKNLKYILLFFSNNIFSTKQQNVYGKLFFLYTIILYKQKYLVYDQS